jgi:hypothetical protein
MSQKAGRMASTSRQTKKPNHFWLGFFGSDLGWIYAPDLKVSD